MKHEQLTGKIIEIFYEVYNELGHGFLESVYDAWDQSSMPEFKRMVFDNERKRAKKAVELRPGNEMI